MTEPRISARIFANLENLLTSNEALEAAAGAWPAELVPGKVFPAATAEEIAGAEEINLQAAQEIILAAVGVARKLEEAYRDKGR